MDALELYRRQLSLNRWAWGVMLAGLDDDTFNWIPPGRANTIAATLLHALGMEDFYVQEALQAKMILWESQAWAVSLGLAELPNQGNAWSEVRTRRLDLAQVMRYGEAVHAATQATVESLTPAELERELPLGPRIRCVADLLATLLLHNASHGGEIAALKGLQGLKARQLCYNGPA